MTNREDLDDTSISVSLAGKKMQVSLEARENHRIQHPQQITPMDYRRLGPEPAGNSTIVEMWDRICLTDGEQPIVRILSEAVGIPIARLGCTGDGPNRRPIVRLEGEQQTIPLRRLGHGATQTAAILMALETARGGLLLLDLPETGINFRTNRVLWKWILREASASSTQVFVATQSWEIIRAAMTAAQDLLEPTMMLVRLEHPADRAHLTYSQDELEEVIRLGWEIR